MHLRSAVPRRGAAVMGSPPASVVEEGVDLASLLLQEPSEYDFDSAEEGDEDWDEGAYAEADEAAPLSREASGRGGTSVLSNGDGPGTPVGGAHGTVRPQHLADVVGAARRSLTNGGQGGRRRPPLRRSISDAAMNRKLIDVAVRLDSVCLSISHDPSKPGLGSPTRATRSTSGGEGGEGKEERKGPTGRRRAETIAEVPLLVLAVTGVGLSAYHTAKSVKGTLAVEAVSLEALGDGAGHELRLLEVTPHEAPPPTDGPSLLIVPGPRRASTMTGTMNATSPRPGNMTPPRRGDRKSVV